MKMWLWWEIMSLGIMCTTYLFVSASGSAFIRRPMVAPKNTEIIIENCQSWACDNFLTPRQRGNCSGFCDTIKKYDNYLPAGVLMEWPVSIQYWTVMWQAKIFGLRIGSDWSDCVARAQLWNLWPENSFCSKFTGCLLFIPLAAMWTFLSAKNLIFKKL